MALQFGTTMQNGRFLFTASLLWALPLFGERRITFTRSVPAIHDVAPAERLAVIYAIGDTQKVSEFVEDLVNAVDRAGRLRLDNAIEGNHYLVADEASLKILRREHPAESYLGVRRFSCEGSEKSGEGSAHDASGERIRRMHYWFDATCSARIEVMNAGGKRLFSFPVHGEGTSPRSPEPSDDAREIAYSQATHYAAVAAAEGITPRFVRESIVLDETAPDFEEGFALIQAGRPADARILWEATVQRHPLSAAAHFDLAAVCEALDDRTAGLVHLQAAAGLAPQEKRFAKGLEGFRRRNGSGIETTAANH